MLSPINFNLDPKWSNRLPFIGGLFPGFRKPWTHGMNGLAYGPDGRVFVATREKIYRFPSWESWVADPPDKVIPAYPSPDYEHAGDLDVDYDGNVWVPVEGKAGPSVIKYNSDLEPLATYHFDRQVWAPWVAVDNQFLYSSDFETDIIHIYDKNDMSWAGMLTLPEKLYRIQGGLRHGNKLYLCLDDNDNPRIVSVVDDKNITVTLEATIPRRAFSWLEKTINWFAKDNIARDQELQGLAIKGIDLQVILGDIHWFTNDDLILLHYSV